VFPRVMWGLLVGLPILGLAGELVCAIERVQQRRAADSFRLRNPNPFEATSVREAADKSLWKVRWSEYQPGARLEMSVAGERYVVEINSQGFRTHEFSERKSPGVLRVVCIGGSTTVEDETYPAILERRLLEMYPSHPLEVLNFGISGSYSDHWLQDPSKLFRYGPDVVVQYEAVNDIIWRALPRYAQDHPWKRRLYRGLLFERLFPIDPRELDPDLARVVENQVRLDQLCRLHRAAHLAGSFAAPDYDTALPEERAHLDVNLADWTADRGALRLTRYKDYGRIVARYDELFEQAVAMRHLEGVMVHRALSDPTLFVDICHMNRNGIARLADVILTAVSPVIAARFPTADPPRAHGVMTATTQ
jgi:hypothetical protein